MKKSDFHYDLPPELIAQAPLPERSASRLLVVPPAPAPFADRGVRDLPELLREGDLLVFNDTRVIQARAFGRKQSGGKVEILVERLLPGNEARVQLGASKPSRAGTRIVLDGGGDPVRLSVADDGVGIADGVLERRLADGHIGLPSHAARIEAAGGTLRVTPGTGGGTVATVELPVP